MDKTTHFFGTSVFGQLISLIDSKIIVSSTKSSDSDRYIKKFKTKDHLISMLFCSFAKCSSLREVSGTNLFTIHDGLKIQIRQQLGDWSEIEIADGRVGWVPKETFKKI